MTAAKPDRDAGRADTVELAATIPRQSLADAVYAAIREAITNKTFLPGRRLTEAGLAEQLDVSKTPVREALLRLREVGLVEPTGGRGGRVVRPSAKRLTDAFEVRAAIEPFTARVAAQRASAGERRGIESAALGSMNAASAADIELFRHHDGTFHRLIATASGNPQLERMLDDTLVVICALVERDVPDIATSIDGGRQHVEIADAIAERRAGDAALGMHEHIEMVSGHILAEFARKQGVDVDAG